MDEIVIKRSELFLIIKESKFLDKKEKKKAVLNEVLRIFNVKNEILKNCIYSNLQDRFFCTFFKMFSKLKHKKDNRTPGTPCQFHCTFYCCIVGKL